MIQDEKSGMEELVHYLCFATVIYLIRLGEMSLVTLETKSQPLCLAIPFKLTKVSVYKIIYQITGIADICGYVRLALVT